MSRHKRVSRETDAAIDDALGLMAISIRLPKKTVALYKSLGRMRGEGYQPLMREALLDWGIDEACRQVGARASKEEA